MAKWMRRALMAFVTVLGLTASWTVVAAESPKANVPNVYGEGILFAFSGLDGKTTFVTPFVASTMGGEVGLKFHLPREQILRFRLPGTDLNALKFRAVASDLILADVPGADSPLAVVFVSADMVVGRVPSGGAVSAEGSGTNTVLLRKADKKRTQFAFAYSAKGGREAANLASKKSMNMSLPLAR